MICLFAQCIWLFVMDCNLPGSSVHGDSPARILEWVAKPSSRVSSQPRDQSISHAVQADSLSPEPPGKPTNIGVSSLSLLQGIFPTKNQTIVGGFLAGSWATREAEDLKHGPKSLRNNFCSFNWSTSYQSYWFIWVFSSWKKSWKWMPGISQRNECIRLNL